MQPIILETRRSLFYVLLAALFFLFSCSSLLRSSSKLLIPESVLTLVLANKTSDGGTSRANDTAKFLQSNPLPLSPEININDKQVRSNKDIENLGQVSSKGCDSDRSLLKVYMYDLPPEFHFGLLGWKGETNRMWPDVAKMDRIPTYPGGLNLQHSIEYWLTMDLLSSNVLSVARPCTAFRVTNSSLANVFFVPFFSSLSYNRHSKPKEIGKASRNKLLQDELVKYLRGREEWNRGGKDHLIVAHHPNSLLEARRKLSSVMFLLADFGRYPPEIANLKKDIIAPYRHVVQSVGNDSATFEDRPTLAYFQGAIHRKDGGKIRQRLYQLLKDEKDVHFAYGSVRDNGIRRTGQGMASSKFCLNIAGDTPSSNRLFDAIVTHCVPVVISDDIELPFEDVLDYSDFCIFIRASDAVKKGFLLDLLRGIKRDEWTKMWERLKQIAHHFEYQYPSKQGDSVQMIWEAVARKISHIHLSLNREKRLHRSQLMKQRR